MSGEIIVENAELILYVLAFYATIGPPLFYNIPVRWNLQFNCSC